MKRTFVLVLLAAMPSLAQQQPAPTPEAKKSVATINGETITVERLNQIYNSMGMAMRDQYDQAGGKGALLDNYIGKRLIVQEALKSGFEKRPDVQADMEAAKESALFDRYVRDVVAAQILNDATMRDYYSKHEKDYLVPERWKVRHIIVTSSPNGRTKDQALAQISKAATELHAQLLSVRATDPAAAAQGRLNRFAALARQYSEDASAPSGGDLGWVTRGQLDPDFEAPMLALPPGTASGIISTRFGYHIIYVEAHKAAAIMPFEEAKPRVREALINEHGPAIIETVRKLTEELRASSKISVYPENIR